MIAIKTLIVLVLAGSLQTKHFLLDGDHRRYDGLTTTICAQPTPERERLQDELSAELFVLDEATNQNVYRHKPVLEFHPSGPYTYRISVGQ